MGELPRVDTSLGYVPRPRIVIEYSDYWEYRRAVLREVERRKATRPESAE